MAAPVGRQAVSRNSKRVGTNEANEMPPHLRLPH